MATKLRALQIPITLFLATFLSIHGVRSWAQAVQTDIATNVTDPSNLDDSEPSIAINPANPLEISIVSFCEGWGPATLAPVWKSFNGGVTWQKLFILSPPSANPAGPADQKIQYSGIGNLFAG